MVSRQAPKQRGRGAAVKAVGTTEMKVKKKCGRPANPTPRHQRPSHIEAEKRRREKIVWNLGYLGQFVPRIDGSSGRQSKAAVLTTAVTQVKQLKESYENKDAEIESLRAEKEALQASIETYQRELPEGRLMDERPKTLEDRFSEIVMQKGWKFFLFSHLTEPMRRNFDQTVDATSKETCEKTTWQWAQGNLGQQQLREMVLRQFSNLGSKVNVEECERNPDFLRQSFEQLKISRLGSSSASSQQSSPLRDSLSALNLDVQSRQNSLGQMVAKQPQQQANASGRGRQSRKRGSASVANADRSKSTAKRSAPKKSRAQRTPTPPNMERTPTSSSRRTTLNSSQSDYSVFTNGVVNTVPQLPVKKERVGGQSTYTPAMLESTGQRNHCLVMTDSMLNRSTGSPDSLSSRSDQGYGTSSCHGSPYSLYNSPPLPDSHESDPMKYSQLVSFDFPGQSEPFGNQSDFGFENQSNWYGGQSDFGLTGQDLGFGSQSDLYQSNRSDLCIAESQSDIGLGCQSADIKLSFSTIDTTTISSTCVASTSANSHVYSDSTCSTSAYSNDPLVATTSSAPLVCGSEPSTTAAKDFLFTSFEHRNASLVDFNEYSFVKDNGLPSNVDDSLKLFPLDDYQNGQLSNSQGLGNQDPLCGLSVTSDLMSQFPFLADVSGNNFDLSVTENDFDLDQFLSTTAVNESFFTSETF